MSSISRFFILRENQVLISSIVVLPSCYAMFNCVLVTQFFPKYEWVP